MKTVQPKSPASIIEPEVYSYLRFSTKKQKEGDSTRRQKEYIVDPAQKFAKAKGLKYNTTVHCQDKGLSAFHGVHRKKGKLGLFLAMVETGQISKGSFLYVENIDRLTREVMFDALKMILFGLLEHGVGLVTYDDMTMEEIIYTEDSINSGLINKLIGEINRAHSESKRKSLIAKSNWQNKRSMIREHKIVTTHRPAWLEVVKDEDGNKIKFRLIPKAAATIQMIFDLKLQGMGKQAMAKKLNQQAPWKTPVNKKGKGGIWSPNYIQKILQSRAVMGEFQPCKVINRKQVPDGEMIPDYYPQVITPDIFHAVQKRFQKNKGKGGKTGKANNLFVSMAKCPYCGGVMAYRDSKRAYLVCYNGQMKVKCQRHSIRYDEVEGLILRNCKGLKPEQILPNASEQTKLCSMLRLRIQGKEAELSDKQNQIDNFVENLGKTTVPTMVTRYERSIEKLEEEVLRIKMEREKDEMDLRHAENDRQSFSKWKSNFETLSTALAEKNNPELRIRLRTHLQELIDKIEIYAVGFKELYNIDKDVEPTQFKGDRKPGYADNTETIVDYLWDVAHEDKADKKLAESKLFKDFVSDITKQRMSKEGRFIRVFFKSGLWMDIVPKGSLAQGMKMAFDEDDKKPKWYAVKPDLNELLADYKDKQKRLNRI